MLNFWVRNYEYKLTKEREKQIIELIAQKNHKNNLKNTVTKRKEE